MPTVKLIDYIKRFSPEERAAFAVAVGTTLGHLNNVAYGLRVASAALCKQIAIATERVVPEWEMRGQDWYLIWPELIGAAGAPSPQADQAEAAHAG